MEQGIYGCTSCQTATGVFGCPVHTPTNPLRAQVAALEEIQRADRQAMADMAKACEQAEAEVAKLEEERRVLLSGTVEGELRLRVAALEERLVQSQAEAAHYFDEINGAEGWREKLAALEKERDQAVLTGYYGSMERNRMAQQERAEQAEAELGRLREAAEELLATQNELGFVGKGMKYRHIEATKRLRDALTPPSGPTATSRSGGAPESSPSTGRGPVGAHQPDSYSNCAICRAMGLAREGT